MKDEKKSIEAQKSNTRHVSGICKKKKGRAMNDLMLPEDFENLPDDYDYERYVTECAKAINFSRRISLKAKLFVGMALIKIWEKEPWGKRIKAYERMDISERNAQRYMQLARTFWDRRDQLEGMTLRKALVIASHYEDGDIELREDEILFKESGDVMTYGQVREIAEKNLKNKMANQQNKDNAEKRELKDKYFNERAEKEALEKQLAELEEYAGKLAKDADPAMAGKIEKLKKQIAEKDKEINELELEKQAEEAKVMSKQESLEFFEERKGEFITLIAQFSNIQTDGDAEFGKEIIHFLDIVSWRLKEAKQLIGDRIEPY